MTGRIGRVRHRPRPHPALAAFLAVGALAVAGCSTAEPPAEQPAPQPAAGAPVTPSTAPPSLADTRTLTPARGLFTVAVPARFTDVPPDAPEASAVAPLAQALRGGVGVLAVDRVSGQGTGYAPTAGGYCTRTPSQDLAQLGEELRTGAVNTQTPTAPPRVTILGAPEATASPRVVVEYPADLGGRPLTVTQVAGLAGPGRACVLSFSTDDPGRDAEVTRTVRDTFRMAG